MEEDYDVILSQNERNQPSNSQEIYLEEKDNIETEHISEDRTAHNMLFVEEELADKFSKILTNLYLGNEDQAHGMQTLYHHKIKGILCLNAYKKHVNTLIKYKQNGIAHHHITINDTPKSDIAPHLDNIYKFIDMFMTTHQNVFVHCQRGISRSATAVIYYLMRKSFETGAYKEFSVQGKILDYLINYVRSKRYIIQPNTGFYKTLKEQEKLLISQYLSPVSSGRKAP